MAGTTLTGSPATPRQQHEESNQQHWSTRLGSCARGRAVGMPDFFRGLSRILLGSRWYSPPVIALAVIVSLRDVLRDFTDDYNMTWVRPGVGDRAARAKVESELGETAYVRNLAYGAAALNMLLQMVILTLALVSLAQRHDVIP